MFCMKKQPQMIVQALLGHLTKDIGSEENYSLGAQRIKRRAYHRLDLLRKQSIALI